MLWLRCQGSTKRAQLLLLREGSKKALPNSARHSRITGVNGSIIVIVLVNLVCLTLSYFDNVANIRMFLCLLLGCLDDPLARHCLTPFPFPTNFCRLRDYVGICSAFHLDPAYLSPQLAITCSYLSYFSYAIFET